MAGGGIEFCLCGGIACHFKKSETMNNFMEETKFTAFNVLLANQKSR
jgi:hypothetical protein